MLLHSSKDIEDLVDLVRGNQLCPVHACIVDDFHYLCYRRDTLECVDDVRSKISNGDADVQV